MKEELTQAEKLAEIKRVLGTETATYRTDFCEIAVDRFCPYDTRFFSSYTVLSSGECLATIAILDTGEPLLSKESGINFIYSILDHVWRDASKVKPQEGAKIDVVAFDSITNKPVLYQNLSAYGDWAYQDGIGCDGSSIYIKDLPWKPAQTVPSWMLEEKGAQS